MHILIVKDLLLKIFFQMKLYYANQIFFYFAGQQFLSLWLLLNSIGP